MTAIIPAESIGERVVTEADLDRLSMEELRAFVAALEAEARERKLHVEWATSDTPLQGFRIRIRWRPFMEGDIA